MKWLSLAFLILLFTSLHATPAKKIVILGDSITEGYGVSRDQAYPALVQKKAEKAGKTWQVVNAGISGSTSASALSRVSWYLKQKPDLLLIVLGANDGLRGTPTHILEENLSKAVALCKNSKVKVVLVGMKLPPNYGLKYTQDFAAVYPRVATNFSVPLVPFLLENVGGEHGLNLADGIHPNEKGHIVIAETIYQAILKYL